MNVINILEIDNLWEKYTIFLRNEMKFALGELEWIHVNDHLKTYRAKMSYCNKKIEFEFEKDMIMFLMRFS